jgi:hypothetical protein
MNRLRHALIAGVLAGLLSGCGEDQPNKPAGPGDVTPDFAKDSANMMKAANTGMDPKAAKAAGKATPKP